MDGRATLTDQTDRKKTPSKCTITSIFAGDEMDSLPKNLQTAIERSQHNYMAKQHLTKLMKNGRSNTLNNRQNFSRYNYHR